MGQPDFADRRDFADADRGFIAARQPGRITDAAGRTVWDADAYAFLSGPCPPTVHPSLWRQSQLCARQGLYRVTEDVYQVRGLDLANLTLIEGDTGVIVVDPLTSTECAEAALALFRAHRGERPVSAVIYTYPHVDHFGGAAGVTDGRVPVIAPAGFLEHAVADTVPAGVARARRASYLSGAPLPPAPYGQVGVGLGLAASTGRRSLVPPSVPVTHTGQEETVDGVRLVFQLTPDTEASVGMNLLIPDRRALCVAENATHNLHTVLTLRGDEVHDARMWSRYLTETIHMFGDRSDVAFASHHWPTWGRDRIVEFLSQQRDLYAYLHDQTLRLLNRGYRGAEIAERMRMPPVLERAWHARGYHGSVPDNVKAICQRYLGWFDGNPAHLWEHPPVASARRYVDCLGGVATVRGLARRYADEGDLRFAAQLLNHAVYAVPDDEAARADLAGVYRRLGFGTENGIWRNCFLTGAHELTDGVAPVPVEAAGELVRALSIEQVFDMVAVRVDGPRAWDLVLAIDWHLTDTGERYRTQLSNGVLVHYRDPAGEADLRLTLTRAQVVDLFTGRTTDTVSDNGPDITQEGNAEALKRLLAVLDSPDPAFPIVTPRPT